MFPKKISKKRIVLIVLLFCILARFYIFPSPFDENLPLGTNQGNYLHYIDALKTKNIGDWDYSWSAGFPLLTFYQPFSIIIASVLTPFLSTITAFKLVFSLFFALTPLAFYFLSNEFKLTIKEKIIALLIFSFTFYYNAIVAVGMQFALIVSTLFGILFFKFFISSIKNYNVKNLVLASFFLGLTMVSHLLITVTFGLLSLFYLISSLYVKYSASKLKRALFIYFAGFLISAFWTVPLLLQNSQNGFVELPRADITAIPFVDIPILYGYYVNFASVTIGGLAILLLLWCLKKEFEIPMKKNIDSSFLKIAIVSSFVVFTLIYLIFPQHFPIKADRFINIWIIPFAILFARGINGKVTKYLVMIFALSQIVLFIGTPIQTTNSYSKYYEVFDSLKGTDGRVTFEPAASGIDLLILYLAPEQNLSLTMGDIGPTISPKRSVLLGNNITMFDCASRRNMMSQLFSLDIFSRKSVVYVDKCKLVLPDYKKIFDLQHTTRVVADKAFPEVVDVFSNDSDFSRLKETDHFVIFSYDKSRYIDTDQDVDYSVLKEKNRITLTLSSAVKKTGLKVRMSEGWYPFWSSKDVSITEDDYGYISFVVPELQGEKKIVLDYTKPLYYPITGLISIISLVAIFAFYVYDSFLNKKY